MTVRCPRCKMLSPTINRFCIDCGTPLQPPFAQTGRIVAQSTKKKSRRPFIALLSIVSVAAIGGLVWLGVFNYFLLQGVTNTRAGQDQIAITNTNIPTTVRSTTAISAITTVNNVQAVIPGSNTSSGLVLTSTVATTPQSTTQVLINPVKTSPVTTIPSAPTTAVNVNSITTPTTTNPPFITTAASQSDSLIENIKFEGNTGRKGGNITYAFAGQFPSSLQPYFTYGDVDRTVLRQIYASAIGRSNNSKYYPYLLTQVPTLDNGEVKVNSNGKTMDITLNLKPGLKWSDGSALTSKDFAFTWKWVTNPDNAQNIRFYLGIWQKINEVQTPDNLTVVLKWNEIYGPYLEFLANFMPLPERIWNNIAFKDADKSPESSRPSVTSGPMVVSKYNQDSSIQLVRNTNFSPIWGFNAYLDSITLVNSLDDDEALADLKNQKVDLIDNFVETNFSQANNITSATNYTVQNFNNYEFLVFNQLNPILKEQKVRQALSLAIDKTSLIKQFRTPQTQELAVAYPTKLLFSNKLLSIPKYDTQTANSLLDDAGWKMGSDGIRTKDGKKLTFVLSSTTAPVRAATAEAILAYWKIIGVTAKFQPIRSTEFFDSWPNDGVLAKGKFDVAMFAQEETLDPSFMYSRFHSAGIPSQNNPAGGNYGRIKDTKLDQLLDSQYITVDQNERKLIWYEVQDIFFQQVYAAPLYSRVVNFTVSKKLKNIKPNSSDDTNFWNVVEWYLGN